MMGGLSRIGAVVLIGGFNDLGKLLGLSATGGFVEATPPISEGTSTFGEVRSGGLSKGFGERLGGLGFAGGRIGVLAVSGDFFSNGLNGGFSKGFANGFIGGGENCGLSAPFFNALSSHEDFVGLHLFWSTIFEGEEGGVSSPERFKGRSKPSSPVKGYPNDRPSAVEPSPSTGSFFTPLPETSSNAGGNSLEPSAVVEARAREKDGLAVDPEPAALLFLDKLPGCCELLHLLFIEPSLFSIAL